MHALSKILVLGIVVIAAAVKPAYAKAAKFNSLVCRSYDYYQLGGDRKVLEIAIRQAPDGFYHSTVSNIFEIRLADGAFQERDRNTITDYQGQTCLQAEPTDDPRVVTCAFTSS